MMSSKESGIVLPVTLLILALLLISVLSMTNVNTIEGKITAGDTDKNIAFEAAETTLRIVENNLAVLDKLDGFDGTAGLYGVGNLEPNSLLRASYTLKAPAITGLAENPVYFIKYLGQYLPKSDSVAINGYGTGVQPGSVSVFRITVMAKGVSNTTSVVLQSYYERRFL